MSTLTQRLAFLISANADDAVRAFERTGAVADRELGRATDRLDKVGGGLRKSGAAALAFSGVAGAALFSTARSWADLGLRVGKFADATNIAAQDASRWIEVVEDIGGSADGLQSIMVRLARQVQTNADAFNTWGVTIARTSSGAVDVNATMMNALDTLSRIEDPARRAAAAQELFGRSWQQIAELVDAGAGQVKAALASVSDAKVYDAQQVAEARKFRDDMDQLVDSLQSVALQVGRGVVPAVSALGDVVERAVSTFETMPEPMRQLVGGALAVGTATLGAGGALSFVAGQAIKSRDAIKSLVTNMTPAKGAALGVAAAVGVAAIAYDRFTQHQRKVEERAEQVGAALREQIVQTIKSGDVAEAAAFGLQKLAESLAGGDKDGERFKAALGQIGLTVEDILPLFDQLGKDPVATLTRLAQQAGLTAEEARYLAERVNELDSVAGGLDWGDMMSREIAKFERLPGGQELADRMAIIGAALEELQDQAENTDFDKLLRPQITALAADAGTAGQELLKLAESNTGVARTGAGLLPLWQEFTRLLAESGAIAPDVAAGLDDVDTSGADAAASVAELGRNAQTGAEQLDALSSAGDRFKTAMDKVRGGAVDMETAQRDYLAAAEAVAAAIAENGTSLDINTAKGRANREALQAQADAAMEVVAAMIANGAPTRDAVAWSDAYRDSIINQATQLGLTRAEVETYLAAIGMTPENVETAVKIARKEKALEDIEALKTKLDEIDPTVQSEIQALIDEGKLGEAKRRLEELVKTRDAFINVFVRPQNQPSSWDTDGDGIPNGVDSTPAGRSAGRPTASPPADDDPAAVVPSSGSRSDGSRTAQSVVVDDMTLSYSTGSTSPAGSSPAGGLTDEQQKVLDRLEKARNKFQAGKLGLAEYLKAVRDARGIYEQWTDEWSNLDDEANAAMAADKDSTAADRQDAEDRRRDRVLRRLEIARNQYRAGKIGLGRYRRALQAARKLYRPWSDEWTRLRDEERQAVRDARQEQTSSDTDPWETAGNLQAAAEARVELQRAQSSAYDALTDDTGDNDAAALDSWARAIYGDIVARANVRFKPRSRRWARWTRARLQEAIAANPMLASRLRVYLLGIPRYPKPDGNSGGSDDAERGDSSSDDASSMAADDTSTPATGDRSSTSTSSRRSSTTVTARNEDVPPAWVDAAIRALANAIGPRISVDVHTLRADREIGRVIAESLNELAITVPGVGDRWVTGS